MRFELRPPTDPPQDLSSASTPVISLPIGALPHVINPSLALSVLPDMLPRLGHSNPAIRKKTIATLYRMALVYPETLRAAWPRIKERLMDRNEDSSVTSAVVNIVCELGPRRPRDFLPLAPRLFELLVDSGNNWMVIKLIKLFAALTPLEPRLVRKLLPPLTELIRHTKAMSVLYECINGIIQGGILGADDSGSDEIATLCVSKLRSMILVDGDPNCEFQGRVAGRAGTCPERRRHDGPTPRRTASLMAVLCLNTSQWPDSLFLCRQVTVMGQ
jgi:AP-3 complex subunit delta-1